MTRRKAGFVLRDTNTFQFLFSFYNFYATIKSIETCLLAGVSDGSMELRKEL